MCRSGYSDDIDSWSYICWRGAVASAIKGKRGQVFFKELLNALDGMSVKRLITDKLEVNGEYCTLGVLGNARAIDMEKINPYEPAQVSKGFNIAKALAQEVMFMNDEGHYDKEAPDRRWSRMRKWVTDQIKDKNGWRKEDAKLSSL